MGLPLSLEGVGAVLGLKEQKMKEGKDLIRYFCVPCKPTKANGGRTRNLPCHAPDKWAIFKSYNERDVVTEMGIKEKLHKFPVPDFIWNEYHLDQQINDRGILVDMQLVKNAIAFDERSKSDISSQMKDMTDLENPNSVVQMKAWLSDQGLETDTLGKKAVAELIKEAPDDLAQVLSLRQQLAKSSVKKYQAMENAACNDTRARGMFQFYGANRTGRWAGRLIQLQNLPQNHMDGAAACYLPPSLPAGSSPTLNPGSGRTSSAVKVLPMKVSALLRNGSALKVTVRSLSRTLYRRFQETSL